MRVRLALGIAATCALSAPVAISAPGAAGTQATSSSATLKARAEVFFKKGLKAYSNGRYKDAIDAFLQAHHIYPSPALSFNAARAYEKLGDSAGALRFYRAYLRQAPKAADRASVQKRVGQLEAILARNGVQQVTVMSEPDGATVIIDGRPVGVTPWTGEIYPGRHHLRLRRETYREAQRDFTLPDLSAIEVNVKLEPLPPQAAAVPKPAPQPSLAKPPPKPPAPAKPARHNVRLPTWIAFGVGGAALGTAAVFEGLSLSSENSVKTSRTQLERTSAYNTMNRDITTARILAGAGAAALVVGGVLLYFDVTRGNSEKSTEIGLACLPGGCQAAFGGRW